ncbi:MAG TPA: acyl-CoA synthetase [Rhodospirillaceae bacterium]|nr:acyl-CoA synthetase [Rhodospirillaceae bacterium]
MAKAKTPAKGKAKASGGNSSGTNRMVISLALIALVPFSLPTLLVLFVGMLPTLVAALAERGANRYAWICVGGLNFAGLASWLLALWFGHHEFSYALQEITDINMLMAAYGASAFGWALYLVMPPVVGTFMAANSQRRAGSLASQQRKLVELWGEEVAGGRDDEEIDLL